MPASPAAGCASTRPASGIARQPALRERAQPPRPRCCRRWSARLLGLRGPDVQGAVVLGRPELRRARDAEAEAVHLTALLDVAQLRGVLERAEQLILASDDDDLERR